MTQTTQAAQTRQAARNPFAAAALALTLAAAPALVLAPAAQAQSAPVTDPARAAAGAYVLEKTHASLTARVSHLGFSNYTFRFKAFDAAYDYNPAAPEASVITVSVDPKSIDTGDSKFDEKLAGKDWLNAAEHPAITFKSTAITRAGNTGTVTGDLTLLGVTKPVVMNVTYNGSGSSFGKTLMGFSGTFSINRSEFGMKTYIPAVGDRIDFAVEVEFMKK